MKRILVMALVACFVLGAAMANAETKFSGSFEHSLEWTDNQDFQEGSADNNNEEDFTALQRVRLYFEHVTSEDLRAVIGFEFDTTWGAQDSNDEYGGGAIGSDGGQLEIKHAYTDFKTGPLSWRVGLQGLAFPSSVAGNPIFASDLAGIVTSYAFNENVSVVAAYARLWDGNNTTTDQADDEIDAAVVLLPITMDGWNVTPYAAYAMAGTGSNTTALAFPVIDLTNPSSAVGYTDSVTATWVGAALGVNMFDPFTFGMDLIYGSVDGDEAEDNDRSGWYFAAIGTYKLDMVTPSLAFIYGTGDDDDITNGSETMPTLACGGGAHSGLALTEFGLNGAGGTESGDILNNSRTDFMAVALILDDISFLENLKHKFVLVYGKGTSDESNANRANIMVTEEDSFWEVNLDSTYAIYENLALNVNMAYLDVDRDEDTWTTAGADLDAASKLFVNLTYKF
ncbi:MAG: outer membrane homotrimeric porin [Proteobacteria bacterium]|nr:outer membrane homotrimeric porin [Pseudomonadota bacterium]